MNCGLFFGGGMNSIIAMSPSDLEFFQKADATESLKRHFLGGGLIDLMV